MESEAIQRLRSAERVAVITGAGISAESGIPTFRGAGGLWRNFRAEELATPAAFRKDPKLVWEWYDWRRKICRQAEPNPAQHVVAKMERHYPEFLLITQNVDGLHPRAGSRKLLEIHGNIFQGRCTACGRIVALEEVPLPEIPPRCGECGGLLRPHIVWFGETYFPGVLEQAFGFLSRTQVVLVVGTSGAVYTPVQMALYALQHGAYLIEVNPNRSGLSSMASCYLPEKAGDCLPRLWDAVRRGE